MTLVAGVDSSTQSVKIVVCDAETGAVVRSSRAPHPDGTEVSAAAWWDAYRAAADQPGLLDGVEAIAVGGQQHGMVTLDADGGLVRDALLWNDVRSAGDAADLIAELGGRRPGPTRSAPCPLASMTITKLRWLARSEPELAERVASVVLPHDYLTWELGGRSFAPVTDRGDASGTCYFDPASGTYRDDLVAARLRPDDRPAPGGRPRRGRRPHARRHRHRRRDRRQHGRRPRPRARVRVRRRLARHQRHRLHPQRRPRPTSRPGRSPGSPTPPASSCRWSAPSTGPATWWPPPRSSGVTLDELARLALTAPPGRGGLVFLPFLEGERTPSLPHATGELVGLTLSSMKPANLARAAIEGVLWSLAYGVDVLREQTGTISAITLTGGASQSEAVRRIATSVFGLPSSSPRPSRASPSAPPARPPGP